MISTPICDFVRTYTVGDPVRFHMPGHKGKGILGCEGIDITEIHGADDVYRPTGVIAESEKNASQLFGCPTVYSTEGSSLAIRAMLYLAYTQAGGKGRCLVGRNAHKSFLYAAMLLDFPIRWLRAGNNYLSCSVSAEAVETAVLEMSEKPFAVFLTSPDYLGNISDIHRISETCRKYGIPLLVDNAHGAYLKFLPSSQHPMDLGADMCCDSAHKTLPVLTGGAYLHFRDPRMADRIKGAMALFGSTSPSWLILQSLDAANPYLERLPDTSAAPTYCIAALKKALLKHGFSLIGDEPWKLTLCAAKWGYSGAEIASLLEQVNIFCEFADQDFIVFMLTPQNTSEQLKFLQKTLCEIPKREPKPEVSLPSAIPEVVCSPHQAAFALQERIPIEHSLGRVLADANVSCPPAVPIVMCGERIDKTMQEALHRFGVEWVTVVK